VGSTGVGYTLHSDQGDVAGAIVIAVELVGVFTRQTDPESIHWVAFAAFIATLLAIIKVSFINLFDHEFCLAT
jgi:RsiW-degrading membrane proteinase PrsW (M82 family)